MDFNSFCGRPRTIAGLKDAFGGAQVAHAYLFTGPEGCGKRALARICARALMCSGESKPCGVCPACQRISAGSHPDYIEIRAARAEITIDQARDVIAAIAERPFEGGKRAVLLIDEINAAAQNALLKTFEQPPHGTVFFIAAESVSRLLPTVVSRMRVITLGAVSHDECVRALCERGVEPAAANELSALSGGLIGRALKWSESADFSKMRELAGSFFSEDTLTRPADIMLMVKDIKREGVPAFIEALEYQASGIIRLKCGAMPAGGADDKMRRAAESVTAKKAAGLADAIAVCRQRLKGNIAWQSAVEPIVFAWTAEDN